MQSLSWVDESDIICDDSLGQHLSDAFMFVGICWCIKL